MRLRGRKTIEYHVSITANKTGPIEEAKEVSRLTFLDFTHARRFVEFFCLPGFTATLVEVDRYVRLF